MNKKGRNCGFVGIFRVRFQPVCLQPVRLQPVRLQPVRLQPVRLQGILPVSFRIFSQSCTKACLCSKRAGPNSHVALKTRHAQTGGPKNPVFERRDFYPLLTISFAKYNYYSKIFTLQEVFLSGSRIHHALISIVNRETHQTDRSNQLIGALNGPPETSPVNHFN